MRSSGRDRFVSGPIELRLGRWQDVLKDVETCDAVITDPPYSARTHAGQRTGTSIRAPTIDYAGLTEAHAEELAHYTASLRPHWVVVWSDHLAQLWHETAMLGEGLYVFAPIPWIKRAAPPRLSGDGPQCSSEWVTVARPKTAVRGARAGSRPGWYVARGRLGREPRSGIAGNKDLDGVRSIVRDYTLPGDLIVDCYAGLGTTLLAAAIEGRRAIGAEMDPETFAKAVKRIQGGWTPAMSLERKPKPKQTGLF